MTRTARTSHSRRFLDALYGDAPRGALVELRYRWGVGMRRMFVAAAWPGTVATMIARWSAQTDVYVGVVCRRQRGGGRGDLVAGASVVWVDCDTVDSAAKARSFSPAPSMVVRSGGSGDNIHAYWLLVDCAEITSIEQANRRLAYALGADMACTDGARIIRPPSSLNWKHHPPAVVELDSCDLRARYALDDVVGAVPDPPDHARDRAIPFERTAPTDDPLLGIDPVTYVERLAGVRVPRGGKVECPFHDDGTPSLQVYAEVERGWYCYGCLRGGTIYDFAAWTFGLTTRGGDFLELRRRLTELFSGGG